MLNVEAKGGGEICAAPSRRGGAGAAVSAAHERGRRLKMSLNFDFGAFCDHAFHGRLADVQRMLELESGKLPVNGNLNAALVQAVENGHVNIVDYLLRHAMFDPSAEGNLALRWAARKGHLAVIERLLEDERVDPSAINNSALRTAARNGHLAVVDRLLQDVRVDPSADDNYTVRCAAREGHLAVVERLLQDERVDVAVAIRHSLPQHLKRFECRERLTEICIALQDLALPAWVTVQILDAARPWSTLPLHSKWNLVCAVKHFHDKRNPEQ
jgi:ankyrin repeat protein